MVTFPQEQNIPQRDIKQKTTKIDLPTNWQSKWLYLYDGTYQQIGKGSKVDGHVYGAGPQVQVGDILHLIFPVGQ